MHLEDSQQLVAYRQLLIALLPMLARALHYTRATFRIQQTSIRHLKQYEANVINSSRALPVH